MRNHAKALLPDQRNSNVQNTHFLIEQICLIVTAQIAVFNLAAHTFSFLPGLLPQPLLHMQVPAAAAAAFASAALFLSEPIRSRRTHWIASVLAVLTTVIALASFEVPAFQVIANSGQYLEGIRNDLHETQVPVSSIVFSLMGIAILFIRAGNSLWGRIADAYAACIAFVVLILSADFVFSIAQMPGSSGTNTTSISTLGCLVLLTVVIFFRRAEHGIFTIFLGPGIGGRIARAVAPILVLLPLLREIARARVLSTQLLPTTYRTAVLTALTTIVSFALLMMLSRQINKMQNEIQDLSLRDELTGLYNVRGFNLFADQAFRLARRAQQPFAVLFVDMDNLKIINDELGHSTGSLSIIETAKLLSTQFRETDVIGRIGGDEFVMAGQFDQPEIESAIERLRSATAAKSIIPGKNLFLSLSIGFSVTDHTREDTLKTVIARADKAMYREKRAKKSSRPALLEHAQQEAMVSPADSTMHLAPGPQSEPAPAPSTAPTQL